MQSIIEANYSPKPQCHRIDIKDFGSKLTGAGQD
jgi:hypothetical protein